MMPEWWHDNPYLRHLQHVPVWLFVVLGTIWFVMRRFEYQTDAYAAWLTGDPEALITGLIKLHRLNLMPMQWGQWQEGLSTHPSTSLRLETIARHSGVSRQRLEEIVQKPELVDGECYPLPAALAERGLVFSSAFRRQAAVRTMWTFFTSLLLPPTLVAVAVYWTDREGVPRWSVLGGGVVLTCVVVLLRENFAPLRTYATLRRRLTDRYKADGFDVEALGGTFVSFSPDGTPRFYEGWTVWDFGFFWLIGDRLCYHGEQAKFVLSREQVTQVCLGPGMPRWWPVPYVYVSWHDPERGTSGVFHLRPGQVRSMRELRRASLDLEKTLQQWRQQGAAEAELPAPLAELSSPSLGDVTSTPIIATVGKGLRIVAGRLVVFGGLLGILGGIPVTWADGWLIAYIPAAALVALGFGLLPMWLRRRSLSRNVSPVLERSERVTAASRS
jgi:hypothetical protein